MSILRSAVLLATLGIAMVGLETWPEERVEPIDAEKLLYLLQYVGADYGFAIRDGQIASIYEYQEMLSYTRTLVEHFDDLHRRGAPEELHSGLVELLDLTLAHAPVEQVRTLASQLTDRLVATLDVVALPQALPDLERGERLYVDNCAPCHGPTGAADGRAAPGMDPPPTSFREQRMNLVSPHQAYGATTFGCDQTAMPSFRGSLTPMEIWDVSFFVMTLREDFAPRRPDPEFKLSISDLATLSNRQLLIRAQRTRPEIEPAHIDYLRSR